MRHCSHLTLAGAVLAAPLDGLEFTPEDIVHTFVTSHYEGDDDPEWVDDVSAK